tara:strand:+ start:3929 stop:4402 length:474 start_codon:yes stop_codon:yes gene_type:complete
MLVSLATTKAGAAIIIMLGAVVSWAERAYYEGLLKDSISTLSILIVETVVFLALVLAWASSSHKRRSAIVRDISLLSNERWLFFTVFAVFGLLSAYASDVSLIKHGTATIQLGGIVIALGVSAALYMLSVQREKALTTFPWLLGLIVCAVGLATSGS